VISLVAAACASPAQRFTERATALGLGTETVAGTLFQHMVFRRARGASRTLHVYLDGDGEHPTICGTGTEDYVGGAWGFGGETFSTLFLGYPGGVPGDRVIGEDPGDEQFLVLEKHQKLSPNVMIPRIPRPMVNSRRRP